MNPIKETGKTQKDIDSLSLKIAEVYLSDDSEAVKNAKLAVLFNEWFELTGVIRLA